MEYFSLIQKYISPEKNPLAYRIYVVHVTLVTQKALKIAEHFSLSREDLTFLEEASMLHDIGICRVHDPEIGCYGELPYIQHVVEGGKILRKEGYPRHARVAETHTGVGILAGEIQEKQLPLPEQDYVPEDRIAEIISFADLFFSKSPEKIWREKTWDEVQTEIGRYGVWHTQRLQAWGETYLPFS